jgi:HEPN domain-containing protein
MKPITLEWIEKAEEDYYSGWRDLRARKKPNYDSACFHAQQCIEKYLKARLIEADISFPKTHDLTQLLELLRPVEPMWLASLEPARLLTDYAVEFRYPGEWADKETASKAMKICSQMRSVARQSLGLPL